MSNYRIVTAKLKGVGQKSIFVEGKRHNKDVCVPRSLMHGADDLALAKSRLNETLTFRLMDWKAEELGL